jgi:hypothetical protein
MCQSPAGRMVPMERTGCSCSCSCPATMTVEEEIRFLEAHKKVLQVQVNGIEKKITDLRSAKEL